jgi:hypothetical protein
MATTVSLKPNAVEISGSTSGTTTLQATAVAGTTTLTLPAATDTLVGKATTDTLTNKTLTAPTLASANIITALTLTGASGTNGQALTSGGSGNAPTWTTISATPGGSTTQVQYNNAGAFGGISGVTTDGTRMTASTTIGVGAATPSTSGAGITFPATDSPSSNANTLDDYEEGTYTPTFASMTVNSGTAVYSGKYTKIGNLCYAVFGTTGTQNITAVAGTTQFTVPFPASAIAFTNGLGSGPGLAQNGATSATSGLQGPGNGASNGYFIQGLAATASIVGTITYHTA